MNKFNPTGPEDVDRVLNAIRATTYQLAPYTSWVVKASRMVTIRWFEAMINSSLQEGLSWGLLRRLWFAPT